MNIPKLLYANGKDSNALYVTGVYIPDPYYFLDFGDKKYIFLDDREVGVFLDHNTNPAIEVVNVDAYLAEARTMADTEQIMYKLGRIILREYSVAHALVPPNFPVGLADYLRAGGIHLVVQHPLYSARLQKQQHEIAHLRQVLGVTSKAFALIERVLGESIIAEGYLIYKGKRLTSETLKAMVEQLFLEHGVSNEEGIIISCGPHAAIPHHQGKGELRANETIVCDIFPRHKESGYYADMTRTYVKGVPTPEMRRMYEAVAKVQKDAIARIAPGVVGKAVHRECQKQFIELGFVTANGEGFTHGTGHGVGLDVHELPSLSSSYEEPLVAGNVVTVEPGLYYASHGGVRIEDVVLVTEAGAELLSQHPYTWIID